MISMRFLGISDVKLVISMVIYGEFKVIYGDLNGKNHR